MMVSFNPKIMERFLKLLSWAMMIVTIGLSLISCTDDVEDSTASPGIIPPYKETFDDVHAINSFTVIDANGDGDTWNFAFNKMQVQYNHFNNMDDWLFTPSIVFESDKLYSFSIALRVNNDGAPARFEIELGTSPNPQSMSMIVIDSTYVSSKTYKYYSGYIKIPESGAYYIGIHGICPPGDNCLYLDDLYISEPYSNPQYDRDLIGAWELYQADGAPVYGYQVNWLEFFRDGRGTYYYYQNGDQKSMGMTYKIKWSDNKNDMNINYADGHTSSMQYWFNTNRSYLYTQWDEEGISHTNVYRYVTDPDWVPMNESYLPVDSAESMSAPLTPGLIQNEQ